MITYDVETTTSNKGDPFDNSNKCVRLGVKYYKDDKFFLCYGNAFYPQLQEIFDTEEWVIGFNIKFDLHWARRLGYDVSKLKVWDCQIAQFLLRKQSTPYPSLNDCLAEARLPLKIDKVAKFWDSGIDTDKIPLDILDEYLQGDLTSTEALFRWQYPKIKEAGLYPLMTLLCQDLLVLEEMEFNGIKYDSAASIEYANKLQGESDGILAEIYDHLGFSNFNIGSGDHLSAVLYGGTIIEDVRIPKGFYKTGKRVGQQRFSIEKREHHFQRRFKPLQNSELKKPGFWSTDEDTLNKIKPIDKKDQFLIDKIMQFRKNAKLVSTYLKGWPAFIEKHNWDHDTIHSSLNQCVAVTGRLSSTSPNVQNADPITKKFMYARNGVKMNIDVKGLEVVCAAFLSNDEVLLKELRDGVDIHESNRKAFNLPERVIAKVLKFRILYGGTEYGFVKDSDFTSVSTSLDYWKNAINEYYNKYKGIAKWHKELVKMAMMGDIVSPFGRRYHYDCSGERLPEAMIKNYPVQGFGADIVALLRVLLYDKVKDLPGVLLVNTVHDSIEIDLKENMVDTVSEMVYNTLHELNGEMKKRFNVDFPLQIECEIETYGRL